MVVRGALRLWVKTLVLIALRHRLIVDVARVPDLAVSLIVRLGHHELFAARVLGLFLLFDDLPHDMTTM